MGILEKQFSSVLTSQGELVGSITHDLKGLLSGVEGGIYLVNSGLTKDNKERVKEGLEMMQRSLGRIKRTVASSLYYVKDRDIDWQSMNSRELVSSIKKELQDHASHLGVDLRAKPGAGSFEADKFAIQSVLSNLVEYSLQACQIAKMKPSPIVTLSSKADREHVVFELLVDGFVMEDETRTLALSDYYLPRGVDRSHLSLFVAHRILKNHRGTLDITCKKEQGTTLFLVTLPQARPPDSKDESISQSEQMLAEEWGDETE